MQINKHEQKKGKLFPINSIWERLECLLGTYLANPYVLFLLIWVISQHSKKVETNFVSVPNKLSGLLGMPIHDLQIHPDTQPSSSRPKTNNPFPQLF